MIDFIGTYYNWFKAFHIISVIAWMAAMLYLPRLFVYHADAEIGSDLSETFKVMERRLLKFIMKPAMTAAWIFGSLLLLVSWEAIMATGGWMHAKITLILIMSGLHGVFTKWQRVFEQDQNQKSAKFYKIWNEVPAVLMVMIVILAIVEPF